MSSFIDSGLVGAPRRGSPSRGVSLLNNVGLYNPSRGVSLLNNMELHNPSRGVSLLNNVGLYSEVAVLSFLERVVWVVGVMCRVSSSPVHVEYNNVDTSPCPGCSQLNAGKSAISECISNLYVRPMRGDRCCCHQFCRLFLPTVESILFAILFLFVHVYVCITIVTPRTIRKPSVRCLNIFQSSHLLDASVPHVLLYTRVYSTR